MQDKRIIFFDNSPEYNCTRILVPSEGMTEEQCLAHVPKEEQYEVVGAETIPTDRIFRNAWFHDTTNSTQKIGIDINKAKGICHDHRRAKRAQEFAPLDEVIAKQIPSQSAQVAEAERQAVRDKHARIQEDIDAAATPEELLSIIEQEDLRPKL